jgi:hypothetical protein
MDDIDRTTTYHARQVFSEVWAQQNADAVCRWWVPDGYAHIQTAYPTPFPGTREKARREIGLMLSAFTGEWEGDVHAAQDGRAVVLWTFAGTHTGPWRGVPATYRQVDFMGLDLIQIHRGRVKEFYRVIDQELDLLVYQLGCRIEPPESVQSEPHRWSATATANAVVAPENR